MITGIAGTELTPEEIEFFEANRPWGFILFSRNIISEEQLSLLTSQLREVTGRDETLIFIDQEGGRVQRLRPPLAPDYPSAAQIGAIYAQDKDKGMRAAWLLGRLHGFDLTRMGINANCMPVLDVPIAGSHQVIGDRAYSSDPAIVSVLGNLTAEGLMAGGVLPVIKHMPGHGRALADSHLNLPKVDATLRELNERDFVPFRALSDLPAAMTAHIIYNQLDPHLPATLSPTIMQCIIREMLGYQGLVMSDDISMRALWDESLWKDRTDKHQSADDKAMNETSTVRHLAALSAGIIAAGCDIVLHCSGILEETVAVSNAIPYLEGQSLRRAELAEVFAGKPDLSDEQELRDEFRNLFSDAGIALEA